MDALAVIGVTVGVVEVLCIFIIRGIACVLKQGGGVEGLKIIMGILVDERDWDENEDGGMPAVRDIDWYRILNCMHDLTCRAWLCICFISCPNRDSK